MLKKVSAELVRLQAEELQDFALDDGRASDLAAEVSVFVGTVKDAAWSLEEDDEPSHFVRALLAGMARWGDA